MEDTSAPLEALPSEIKNKILRELPDARSVLNVALTGPIFYNHIFYDDDGSNERKISSAIVVANVGITLLPMAIARYEASLISWKRVCPSNTEAPIPVTTSWLCEQVVEFVDEHLTGHHITQLPVALSSLSIADNIISCHKAIQHFTEYLSTRTAGYMPDHCRPSSDCMREAIVPNDRENTRFSKALYIFQLASELFVINKYHSVVWDAREATNIALEAFWRKFAPWENQQVRSVQTLLIGYALREIPHATLFIPNFSWNKIWELVVLSQGVIGLHNTYRRGHHLIPLDANFSHLCRSRRIAFPILSQAPVNNEAWYNSETLWLKRTDQPGQQSLYSCDIADLLREFPEEDSGPADAWYHILVQNIRPSRADETSVFQKKEGFERCARCLAYWGFPFWDRERLDYYSQGRFPTMEEMDGKMRKDSGGHLSISVSILDGSPYYMNHSQSCRCNNP
ncbi:hypothetical protein M434DRAFT_38376 [Hypoxylon sp. CO27-5]|nr:hypothetical protein M434DRAFT_38376 [Hypoxylon sp. CO27-5]